MRFGTYIAWVSVLSLISVTTLFAEHTAGTDGRIRRTVAPSSQIGINGHLEWKKDSNNKEFLQLTTPGGQTYILNSKEHAVSDVLQQLAERPKNQVEISGILENKDGQKFLNVQVIERQSLSNYGLYLIKPGDEVSSFERKKLQDFLRSLPTTKLVPFNSEDGTFMIKTDFSQKHLDSALRKERLHYLIDDFGPYVDEN